MKVLHVITSLDTGGAEVALCRLIESLPSPEFEHEVVSLRAAGALESRVAASAVVHSLGMHPGLIFPGTLLRLRRLLRASRPDVIHGWMYHADLAATVAAGGIKVPVIWGIRHSLYGLAREKWATRMVIRACATLSRKPARILYNARVSAEQHVELGFAPARAAVIPNGFDTDRFAPDPGARERVRAELGIAPDAIVIGLIARVHPMKDQAGFLRAAAHFVKKHPQVVFLLVGDGAVRENRRLMSLVEASGVAPQTRLCGPRSDIAAVDNALDICCCASAWGESFPNALAEAMACGVPGVATDVGDTREIIGDTGVVVPPGDPLALSDGWAHVAGLGTSGRTALGLRARTRIVERYSMPAIAQRYAQLYADLYRSVCAREKSGRSL